MKDILRLYHAPTSLQSRVEKLVRQTVEEGSQLPGGEKARQITSFVP